MSPLPACMRRTPRLVAAGLRVAGRPAQHLRPVGRQPLDVLGVLAGMRERVVELRVGEAARVVRGGEGEEGRLAAGELEQRRTHPRSVAQRDPHRVGRRR